MKSVRQQCQQKPPERRDTGASCYDKVLLGNQPQEVPKATARKPFRRNSRANSVSSERSQQQAFHTAGEHTAGEPAQETVCYCVSLYRLAQAKLIGPIKCPTTQRSKMITWSHRRVRQYLDSLCKATSIPCRLRSCEIGWSGDSVWHWVTDWSGWLLAPKAHLAQGIFRAGCNEPSARKAAFNTFPATETVGFGFSRLKLQPPQRPETERGEERTLSGPPLLASARNQRKFHERGQERPWGRE